MSATAEHVSQTRAPLNVTSSESARRFAMSIADYMGGSRFVSVTGAKLQYDRTGKLVITLPAGMARRQITRVEISIAPQGDKAVWDTTYHMSFQRLRRGDFEEVDKILDVTGHQLREVFTDVTGLKTSL